MMAGHSWHCATCGIASKIGEWICFYADEQEYMRISRCPMEYACACLDEVEFECDETRVLPRMVVS